MYGEGEKSTKREYADRYEKLVQLCGPVVTIADEFRTIPDTI